MHRRIAFPSVAAAILILLSTALLALAGRTNSHAKHALPAGEAATQSVIAFVDVNVVPMDKEGVLAHQTVIVRNGKIEVIAPARSAKIPQGATVVEGKGTEYLMPGLADMHVHAEEPDDFLLYVANGVTTILHMGGGSQNLTNLVKNVRKEIEAGKITGPRIFAAFFMDGPENGDPQVAYTEKDARDGVRAAKADRYEFIKVYNSLSSEAFYEIIDEAKRQGLAVVGHGVRAPGLEASLRSGQIMVAHAEEYLYTIFHDKEDRKLIPAAVRLTKETGAYVTPNLSAYNVIAAQWGKPQVAKAFLEQPEARYLRPDLREEWENSSYVHRKGTLGSKPQFLADLTRAFSDGGVPLLLGTDSPTIPGMFPGFSAHEDLDRLVEAGLTPYQALSAGTRTAGEFIHRTVPGAEEVGTVTAGKRADLILLAANPLDNVKNARHPLGVMLKGRWFPQSELQKMLDAMVAKFAAEKAARAVFEQSLKDVGVSRTIEKYKEEQRTDPKWHRLDESYLNNLAYIYLKVKKQNADAIQLFQLNAWLYPESANAYDSLAEAYMDDAQEDLAIQNYEKSVAMNPRNRNAAAMMKKLGKEGASVRPKHAREDAETAEEAKEMPG